MDALSCKFCLSCRSALTLPLHQQFEKQKFAAAIESASDLDEIKGVAAMLLNLYYQQLSATIDIAEGKLG